MVGRPGGETRTGADFEAIDQAAAKAAKDPEVASPPPGASAAPSRPQSEVYDEQIRLNMEAFRRMRWWVFWGIGLPCLAFLISFGVLLFGVLYNYRTFLGLLSFVPERWGWHLLVFVWVMVALFAIVPMTLGLALMKMVSNSKDDGRHEVVTPLTELAKFVHQCIKGAGSSGH